MADRRDKKHKQWLDWQGRTEAITTTYMCSDKQVMVFFCRKKKSGSSEKPGADNDEGCDPLFLMYLTSYVRG